MLKHETPEAALANINSLLAECDVDVDKGAGAGAGTCGDAAAETLEPATIIARAFTGQEKTSGPNHIPLQNQKRRRYTSFEWQNAEARK